MLKLLSAHGHGYRGFNEDAFGVTENFLWMIDGATGVIKERLFPADPSSDACWFANQFSDALARQVKGRGHQEPDLEAMIRSANAEVLAAADEANPDFRNIDHWKRPAASVTVAKVTTTQFIYAAIGDCAALVKKKDGSVIVLGDDRVGKFDRRTVQEMTRLREKNPDTGQDELFDQLKIIEQRKIRNSEAGYWVADLSDTWMDEMVTGSIPLAEIETLMFCTDGLYRLCDTFKTHTPEQLIEQAKGKGIKGLIDELRSLEAEDYDCKKAPRTKVSDDASGIVLDVTGHNLITSVKAVITRGEGDNRQVFLLRTCS